MTSTRNHLRRSPEAVSVATTRPEVKEILLPGEELLEFSARKYRKMYGAAFALLGITLVVEPLLRLFCSLSFVIEFFLGLLLLYMAVREFFLCRKEFAFVTDHRLVYRHVDLLGRPGKVKEIPVSTIASAKLCQRAMAWRDTFTGEVLLVFKEGGQYVTPQLENGQYILDAIRAVKNKLDIDKRLELEATAVGESISANA